jgi:hypothetical protein
MQLKTEQAAGRLFEGREEGSIAFTPTYKYAANSDEYCAFIKNKAGHKRLGICAHKTLIRVYSRVCRFIMPFGVHQPHNCGCASIHHLKH